MGNIYDELITGDEYEYYNRLSVLTAEIRDWKENDLSEESKQLLINEFKELTGGKKMDYDEWAETHEVDLMKEFIEERHFDEWIKYLEEQRIDYVSGEGDLIYDRWKDEQAEREAETQSDAEPKLEVEK